MLVQEKFIEVSEKQAAILRLGLDRGAADCFDERSDGVFDLRYEQVYGDKPIPREISVQRCCEDGFSVWRDETGLPHEIQHLGGVELSRCCKPINYCSNKKA